MAGEKRSCGRSLVCKRRKQEFQSVLLKYFFFIPGTRGDMGSWTMTRRVAEACMSSMVQTAAAGGSKRASLAHVRLPIQRTYHAKQFALFTPKHVRLYSISATKDVPSAHAMSSGFPKPDEIEWQKDLVNSLHLIGFVNRNVNIRYLDSGGVVADTYIKVKRTHKEDTSFLVEFWDSLAEIAMAHLKKDDQIYIAGKVWVENYVDKDNVQKTACKVVARDLKFVGQNYRAEKSDADVEGSSQMSVNIEQQWKDFFDNASDYWDNRYFKRNPKAPDFKHKTSGASLWIEDRRNPLWVKERLQDEFVQSSDDAKLPTNVKKSDVEKVWQAFFANPKEWWDNRESKKSSKHPDFRNKETGEGLWMNSFLTPGWVKSQLAALDSKAKEAGGNGEWSLSSRERSPKTSFEEEDLSFF